MVLAGMHSSRRFRFPNVKPAPSPMNHLVSNPSRAAAIEVALVVVP
jgi:hypothetical protein